MADWIGSFRQGSYLTRERVRRFSLHLLTIEVAFFAMCVAITHGYVFPLEQPISSDFVSFYAAGQLANDGSPALAYDHAAHYASEQQATEPGIGYNFFYYPPTYLLLCAALARLPYLAAFVVFQLGCLLPCVAIAKRIVGAAPLVTLMAFPAVFWAVGCGQNALLTAGLLAAGTALLDRRPVLAGLCLGALSYKPHLALLVPIALAASGYWRSLAAAAGSAVALVLASLVFFGWSTWQAFFEASARAGTIYGAADTTVNLAGMTSTFGLTLVLSGNPAMAAAFQSIVSLGVMAVVAWIWRTRSGLAVRAAVLLAAIPVATPIMLFYDLMLTGISMAWLVRDGRDRGFPPWQRSAVATLFVAPVLSGNMGFALQIGRPPLIAALGLALALRQAIPSTRLRPT